MRRLLSTMALISLGLAAITAALGAAGDPGLAAWLVVLVLPAVRAVRAPGALRFAAWACWSWPLWLAARGSLHPADPVIAAGATAVVVLATAGAPVAAWLAAAAKHPREPDGRVERRLRAIAHLAVALAAGLAVVALLPGVRESANGVVHVEPAGGLPVALFLAVLVAPAALVLREPRLGMRVWSAWALPTAILGFALTDRTLLCHAQLFWPAQVLDGGLATLVTLLLVVGPAVLIATRDEGPERLPQARIARQ